MTFSELPTPCYVVDETRMKRNLEILHGIMERTGARILLAQKAFSMYALYPLIGKYLSGATASGLYEARLCAEEMVRPLARQGVKCENHVFSPAFKEEDIEEILGYCDHIVFNSWRQVEKFGKRAKSAGKSIGLRINPECSTQEGHAIYDPCAPGSRLGVTRDRFLHAVSCDAAMGETAEEAVGETVGKAAGEAVGKAVGGMDLAPGLWEEGMSLLDGLHFHTLCEQDSDDLEKTLDAVEERFGEYLPRMKWINFGGGHHITRDGYDIPRLERCIRRMQENYGLEVYLEPGEAVALNAGYLVTTVLEIQETYGSRFSDTGFMPAESHSVNGPAEEKPQAADSLQTAILDASAACHMPDVLEMPYRPPLQGSGQPWEKPNTYRLGGPTCLAGDMIGDYSFDKPLAEGDRLVFEDMAIYSMVKNNTFNGMPLPAIALRQENGYCSIIKQFGYSDFKSRL